MRERPTEELLAGAIGAGAVVGGAVAGPLWAAALDLGSALATAGIAARAVEETARERGLCPRRALFRAARETSNHPDAPLAARAVEVIVRARAGDSRVLRSVAMLVGRATTTHARALALQLFGSWSACAPLRDLAALGAPIAAARAAMEGAEFVRAMTAAVPEVVAAPSVEIGEWTLSWARQSVNDGASSRDPNARSQSLQEAA